MAKPTRTHDPVRLTKRAVDAARPADREYILWDTALKGFGLRVTPVGKKVYLLKYRTKAGKARKPAIGAHGTVTADRARSIAKDWLAETAKGGDPKGKRDAQRSALIAGARFRDVVEEFVANYAKPRQRTWKETERTLMVNCAGWLDRPISTITKADAYSLLDGLVAKGQKAKARVTRAWLRTLFRWLVQRDALQSSVMEGVELHLERKVRERFYSDKELKAVWKAANALDPIEGGFVKLILLLGVRKSELAGMRRSEFDDPDKPTLWAVPFERVKARKGSKIRQYTIPLPKLAQRLIKSLPQFADDEDLVFPGRYKGKPLVPGSALNNKVREKSKVKDWTYHACRHTVATWLKGQGHSEYERALVLNHAESSVTSGYSHSYPVKLKRQLLEAWAGHVAGLVQPEGAVLLS